MKRWMGTAVAFAAVACMLGTAESAAAVPAAGVCAASVSVVERLGCFDRLAEPDGVVLACRGVGSDLHRLDCYDRAGRAVAAVPPQEPVRSAEAAPPRERKSWRAEVNAGLMQWRLDAQTRMSVGADKAELSWRNFLGGAHATWGAEAWRDHAGYDELSLGLEYRRIELRARVDAQAPRGVAPVRDPITAAGRGEATANLLFLNAAWRKELTDDVALFAGAGIGPGRASVNLRAEVASPLLSQTVSASYDDRVWIYGAQAFAGVNVNLTDSVYLSLATRFIVSSARPFKTNLHFQGLAASTGLGVRF
ncbi:hypothetical protein [Azospirillum sp. TSO22-1]|uniref:outer membrane protein n=1 Tax=Azospirillum sp. TSO22-1 TaxID=716789 RepID=UPI000D61E76E|nr:hypothetical protein [Azospirillum sp. TSO22-1]PWC53601.1 hypothetical protein TSO221_10230 [Azospirillum sp. TSO22-1]